MNTKKLDAQAAAWLVRGEAESFSPDEQARLEEWLAASARNRAVYMRLHAAWRQADKLRRLRPLDGTTNENLLTESVLPSLKRADREPLVHRNRRAWIYIAATSTVALVLVAVVFAARFVIERSTWQTYATDIGGFERLILQDGSTVRVNTNSRIRVRLTEGRRRVLLERGEALFTVAKDPCRAFDVEARGTIIRATGTIFSVRLHEAKSVDVLVTEGHVTIDSPASVPERTAGPNSSSTLSAGETATITVRGLRVAKVDATEAARKMAWTKGQLLFEQQTLAEMAAEFNRYNRRQMVIADPSIAQLRMSAGFDATDPESFVAALAQAYGIRAFHAEAGDADIVRLVGTDGE